jgi:hypothetical protein
MWNKQHQDNLLALEDMYASRIKALEEEVSDVRRENGQFKIENSRIEQELSAQRKVDPLIFVHRMYGNLLILDEHAGSGNYSIC